MQLVTLFSVATKWNEDSTVAEDRDFHEKYSFIFLFGGDFLVCLFVFVLFFCLACCTQEIWCYARQ